MPIEAYIQHRIALLVKTISGRIAKRPITIVTRIRSFSWNNNKKGGNGYQIEKHGSPEEIDAYAENEARVKILNLVPIVC
ncbi:MAG: hypothetical protein QG670_2025 [Thermoproteota archaeon]|nr:hypothetical protein [Thermoproteota archaeon]